MNLALARHIKRVIILWTLISIDFLHANPGREFLTSIITRLKDERPVDNHHLFYDELLKASSRSSDEYQIYENQQESQENQAPYSQENTDFTYNQNQLQQQFDQWKNEPNPALGDDLNSQLVNFQSVLPVNFDQGLLPATATLSPFQSPLPQQHLNGLQYFALNNFMNLPTQQLQPQSLLQPSQDSTTDAANLQSNLPDNTGPHLFNLANDAAHMQMQMQMQQLPRPAYNQQPGTENAGQQLSLPELLKNLHPLQSMYNYYHPDNTIDDNFIDDTINAMKPYGGEQIVGGPSKQFMVEPLFVAMAGFVGIAMIFMSAVLFLPKILSPPPRVSSLKGPQELAALTKLAVQAIEGNDCTERIACEVGRAMRSLHVSGKPIKVLEVLLPEGIAKQLAQIRKAVNNNRQVCRLIQCKPLKATLLRTADKSKSAVEAKSPKSEPESTTNLKAEKKKNVGKGKEPLEPRVEVEKKTESTSKHSVVKKTLKVETTTKKQITSKPSNL